MRAGIVSLVLAYVLSQFYRAFLAVLTPVLATDIAATPENLATASGLWFLAFALMQLPVGWALDRIGPRVTTAALLAVAALGAMVFATASGPVAINLAMVLIGMGCAPVLMASYYIVARTYSPAVFGTLAGITIGIGSLGNIAASLPLSMAVEAIGWRGALWVLGGVTLTTAAATYAIVRDPPRVTNSAGGSLLDLLKMPMLWPVLFMIGASFPMVMAHGRAFLPPALVGRGVTLINLFGIGAAGIMQFVTGRLHAALTPSEAVLNSAAPAAPYAALFAFYAGLIAVGMVVYLFAQDRTD